MQHKDHFHTYIQSKYLFLFAILAWAFQSSHAQTLTVNILADSAVNCLGGSGIVLNTDIVGGQPPYDINWSPNTGLNDSTIEDPTANPSAPIWYTIMVTDALLATATDSIFVDTSSAPTSTFSWPGSTCSAFFAPSPVYTGSNSGNALFYWQLNGNPVIATSTPFFPNAIDITVPGPYTLCMWVEENGCSSDTTCQTLISNHPPLISINPVINQCFPGNQFSFSLTDTTGLDSISWNFGTSANMPGSNSFFPVGIDYLTPGQQSIFAIGYQGSCPTDTAFQTFWVSDPKVDIIADSTACIGDTITFTAIDISQAGASGGFLSWQWFFSNGAANQGQVINQVFTTPGLYSVQLQVTDTFGCTAIDSFSFTVSQAPVGTINFSIANCNEVSFTNTFAIGSYQWDFGDGNGSTVANPVHTYTSPGVYFVMLTVTSACQTVQIPQSLTILPACVWPGDANNDLVANNVDLLAIGVAFGDTGPLRNNASLNWLGQAADHWTDTLANGTNIVYVDSDGNGTINDDDTLAINNNYGLTHNKTEHITGVGPLLYFDSTSISGPIMVGNSFDVPIMLGTPIDPANDVYGIAFTVTYEMHLIDSASARLSTNSSWLGSNLLRIEKDFYLDGELDGAICRKNKTNISSQGQIAKASFVMIDDIAKQFIYDTLTLDFTDVVLIQADGTELPVSTQSLDIVVFQEDIINSNDLGLTAEMVSIYPQPASAHLYISVLGNEPFDLFLSDLSGKHIYRQKGVIHTTQLALKNIAGGVYVLHLTHPKGVLTRKIIIE